MILLRFMLGYVRRCYQGALFWGLILRVGSKVHALGGRGRKQPGMATGAGVEPPVTVLTNTRLLMLADHAVDCGHRKCDFPFRRASRQRAIFSAQILERHGNPVT